MHARKETVSCHGHLNLRGTFPLNRELGETQRRLDQVKDVVRVLSYMLSINDFPVLQRNQIYLYYYVLENALLFHKLSHSYMFRHCRVILRQLVINTLPCYTSISNAAVGNTVYS